MMQLDFLHLLTTPPKQVSFAPVALSPRAKRIMRDHGIAPSLARVVEEAQFGRYTSEGDKW